MTFHCLRTGAAAAAPSGTSAEASGELETDLLESPKYPELAAEFFPCSPSLSFTFHFLFCFMLLYLIYFILISSCPPTLPPQSSSDSEPWLTS